MADQWLMDQKVDVSRQLVEKLQRLHVPLLAAYWEWSSERGRWVFYLVPESASDEKKLVDLTAGVLIESPFRHVFSLSDVVIDGRQIGRARAIGRYIRVPRDVGKRFDTTFTGGHFFEGVIVMYVAPELARQHSVA
jgi:hypothetical protein